ncbi:uncharacterized protein LOC144363250, partial [Saccoglossus kowalevskii]
RVLSIDTNVQATNNTESFDNYTNEHTRNKIELENIQYPLLTVKNIVPNYFTSLSLKERSALNQSKLAISYLHHQKCGGMTMRRCIDKLSLKMKDQHLPYLIWDGSILTFLYQRAIEKNKSMAGYFFYGDAAFGLCDEADISPCSYYTVLRDPYERIVSAYEYCIAVHSKDPICMLWNVSSISLHQFAVYTGSHLFTQLLYSPKICKMKDSNETIQIVGKRNNIDTSKNIPCWYKHKAYLEYLLTSDERQTLLDYVIGNLHNWFTMIGTTDEFGLTMEMLQMVYNLPFVTTCKSISLNRKKQSSSNLRAEKRQRLLADAKVYDALYYDIIIYNEAMKIFQMQKKNYFRFGENV